MKTDKKEYTAEETAKFKDARRAVTRAEREKKRNPVMVHLSKHAADTILKYALSPKGKTFYGSIRQQFTGARRNNQISNI